MISNLLKVFFVLVLYLSLFTSSSSGINYVTWKFDNLSTVGGVSVTPEGNPELISINTAQAVLFDGVEDRIVVDANPLIGMDEFTFEVVFRIDRGGIEEQKFVHMQASPDIRILFEIQFENDSMWYMENYIQTGSGESQNIHLMDPVKLHKADRWYHAAVVYKDKKFIQYINYKGENTGYLDWVKPEDGAVSVGARMNQTNYMTGAVREIRFADVALDSSQFLYSGEILEENETFVLDNLNALNGYDIQVFGNPQIVETEIGKGTAFDGEGDGIYIFNNPIGSSQVFTIETIVKPNDVYPANAEPRYFHIEDANNSNRRITMELRLNNNHEWYFDGFLRADANSLGLMEQGLTHLLNGWQHMAIIYNNGHFETYVNYKKELEADWDHLLLPFSDATKMSVGMRMNKVNYFNGIIQRIRITHAVLDSSEFMKIQTGEVTGNHEIYCPSMNLNFKVFPNPVNSGFEVEVFQSEEGMVTMQLFTIEGAKVDEMKNCYLQAGTSNTSIEFRKYNAGLYLLKVRNSKHEAVQRIMIM
ncbi:LamG-like jellyroll fold domain-containing protein [Saccharicrinis sp. FJH62]|uniref:LamG-like jellyroll fold domain-containing protein n=1 Tax=Saccharicrinis sp. FJH62 TaxID=3344657 RepID=UPI0035D48A51